MNNLVMTPKMIFLLIALAVAFLFLFFISGYQKKLNSIKAEKVGQGQHGSDRFLTDKEAKEIFQIYHLPETLTDMSKEWKRGRIVNYIEKTRTIYVDTSPTHANVEAPTEVGKTTRYVIPNIQYNLMAGTNMIIPSIKRELIDLTIEDAKKLGYETYIIDFESPEKSFGFDFFDDINIAMQKYLETGDLKSKAYAETAAEKLADDIVTSRKKDNNNVNPFFTGASLGLIQSIILMVSMFAEPEQKHFSSVRSILQNIQTMPTTQSPGKKTAEPKVVSLLKGMPDDFGPKKHIGAALAASSETEDNVYSAVLDDLRPMNNSAAEQIISVPGKKEMFSFKSLLKTKQILYIHCPDSMPEYFLFFKLIIKKILTQLANESKKYPGEKLPYEIYIPWDEIGVSPAIQNFDNELAMDRSKGIFFDLIYQDQHQMIEKYGEHNSETIKNQCGIMISLGVARGNVKTAEELSKMCGTQTIRSGSVSRNTGGGSGSSSSYTENMIERPLLTVGEIMNFEHTKNHLVFKRGYPVLKAIYTPYYQDGWGIYPTKKQNDDLPCNFKKIDYMNFHTLEDKLKQYKNQYGIKEEKSTIEITYIENSSNQDQKQIVIDELSQYTDNDPVVSDMINKENYLDLIKYMKKYKTINRYELETILEPLME